MCQNGPVRACHHTQLVISADSIPRTCVNMPTLCVGVCRHVGLKLYNIDPANITCYTVHLTTWPIFNVFFNVYLLYSIHVYVHIYIESEFSTPTQQSLKGWFTSFLVASHCNQKCIQNDLDTCTRCWNGTFLFLHCNAHPNYFICALLVATQRKKRCVPAFNAGNSIIKFCLCTNHQA